MQKKEAEVPDLSRLPANYRKYVAGLQARVRELEAAQVSQQQTSIIVDPYGAKMFLPSRSVVRFLLEPGEEGIDRKHIDCRIIPEPSRALSATGRHLLSVTGGSMIVAYPESGNVVSVGMNPAWL